MAARLRAADPPTVPRLEDEKVLIDLRAILPEQDSLVERAVRAAVRPG